MYLWSSNLKIRIMYNYFILIRRRIKVSLTFADSVSPSATAGLGQLCKPAFLSLHHTDHAIFSRHLIFVGLLLASWESGARSKNRPLSCLFAS